MGLFGLQDKAAGEEYVRELTSMGFKIYATCGTSTALYNSAIRTEAVFRISQGRPNVLDLLQSKEIGWIIITSETGAEARADETRLREAAVINGISITTTLSGLAAAVQGIRDKADFGRLEVCSLQEYHRHIVGGSEK